MKNNNLNNKKIGVFIGKFLPPHIGHINQIKKCLDQCDELIVIVADSKKRTKDICKSANIKPIHAKKRLKLIKKHLKSINNIKFKYLNQGMLEAFPDNLVKWKNKLKHLTNNKFDYWFVDNNYLEISKKYFPEFEFIGFDRTEINISASKIRNDLNDKNNYIIKEAQKYFNNKK
jgi:HTH-type transcriptional repressor of NAD biosynthesis genes